MNQPARSSLALACAACLAIASSAHAVPATPGANITLYRSDSAALYASSGDGNVDGGYAVIREQRSLTLKPGVQDIMLGDLPDHLDAEALALGFPGGGAEVISLRLLLGQGGNAALVGLIGQGVTVLGSNGETLAQGTLLRADDGLLVSGPLGTTLIRQYAAVRAGGGSFPTGSSLRLRIDATLASEAGLTLSSKLLRVAELVTHRGDRR